MKVLQFICLIGFYGVERWVLVLLKYLLDSVLSEFVVILELGIEELELVKQFKVIGKIYYIFMQGCFDLCVVLKLVDLI